ncbi:MAG: hypothetical protein HZA50_08505, partial [Planctomycetes bacterium]|nr:hypothetical protein [Planctomycetota bacterium]
MVRNLSIVLAAITAVLVLGGSAAAEEFDLSKVPVLKVGDQFIAKTASQSSTIVQTADGKIVKDTIEKTEKTSIFEVLAVDEVGKAKEVRRTVVTARKDMQSKALEKGQKEVVIDEVVGTLKKDGLKFAADTTTITSPKMKELTASQIALVKGIFDDSTSLPGYSEDDALLLPSKPVAVGGTWDVDRDKLDKWAEASSASRKVNGKAKSAKFKLASVTDGIADIAGVVDVSVTIAGKAIDFEWHFKAKIDTRTGIWQAKSSENSPECKIDQVTLKGNETSSTTIEYKPGSGKASEPSANMNKLGWAAPGKDDNSFKDAAKGISLDIPKDYETEKPDPQTGVQKFTSNKNTSVGLNASSLPILMDLEEFGPLILKGLKEIDDYELVSKNAIKLPGNVPGELLVATFKQKTVHLPKTWVGRSIKTMDIMQPFVHQVLYPQELEKRKESHDVQLEYSS